MVSQSFSEKIMFIKIETDKNKYIVVYEVDCPGVWRLLGWIWEENLNFQVKYAGLYAFIAKNHL